MSKRILTLSEAELAVDLYLGGNGFAVIAIQLKVPAYSVRAALVERGVPIRTNKEARALQPRYAPRESANV